MLRYRDVRPRLSIFLASVVLFAGTVPLVPTGSSYQDSSDERAITQVIADRQAAWNASDAQGYARLLTPDADIASSSGRIARGRDAVVQLYKEQRAGVFAGASTSTRVVQIRFIRPDVALLDVDRELTGLQANSVATRSRTVCVGEGH